MSRKPQPPAGSASAYAARERQALLDLAVQTLADPTATPADKTAAKERLRAVRPEPSFKAMSTADLKALVEAGREWRRLMAIARGEPAPRTTTEYDAPAARLARLRAAATAAPTLTEQLGLGNR